MTTTKAATVKERQRRQRAERQHEDAELVWARGDALLTTRNAPRLRALCALRRQYEPIMLRETPDKMARLGAFRAAHPELFA